jgi:DeoR family ulaG and ulaABCDEF operon transcriptional repressor
MHANERETMILGLVAERDFISFSELERSMAASPATIRRDLTRLAQDGHILRVRGGVKSTQPVNGDGAAHLGGTRRLLGVPFQENQRLHRAEKEAIGKAASKLCIAGEAVMIDGGSTTVQMCPHIASLGLQVLTNSLHIVAGLIDQADTRILVPSGAVFAEQNIILSAFGDDGMPRFHAPKLFMGAASVGPLGIMQLDIILVASERRFIDKADEIIVLVDSSKFSAPAGHVVCELDRIDTIVTDKGITAETRNMLEKAGVRVVVAE